MQGKFTTSARATQDIKDIYQNTVLKHGRRQAQIYTDGLKSKLQLLADMPDMGRKCSEIRKGYQRHEYARHIIFYKKRDHDILIVRILYDAMDAIRHL